MEGKIYKNSRNKPAFIPLRGILVLIRFLYIYGQLLCIIKKHSLKTTKLSHVNQTGEKGLSFNYTICWEAFIYAYQQETLLGFLRDYMFGINKEKNKYIYLFLSLFIKK
jgi:hypothetical protein